MKVRRGWCRFALLSIAAVLALLPARALWAADKEAIYDEMQAIAAQFESLKDNPATQAERGDLLARYRELSAQLGGDDPARLLKPRASRDMGRPGRRPLGTGSGCVTTPLTFQQTTPVQIPTGPAVVTSTVVVSGAGTYLHEMTLQTFITHTFNADLDITIQSPAGTVVTLSTDNGGANDNVFNGTVWDDDANPGGQVPYVTNNGLATDHAYVNLTTATPLAPEEPLAAFTGENPNGTWTITISDDLAGDGGSLDAWAITVNTLSGPPTTTTTTFTQSTPVQIPTGPAVVTSTLAVPAGGTIFDVKATTFITHSFNADLDITLQSPAGTVVTLSTDNGGANDDVYNGTVWNDKANPGGQVPYATNNGLVTDHAYVNLTLASPLAPEEPLGAFEGEDQSGTWTITISDDLAGDGGNLASWSLDITTGSCQSVAPAAPLTVDGGGNRVLEPNETAVLAPTWDNTGAGPITLTGTTSGFTGPAGATYDNPDNTGSYGTIPAGGSASCTDCYSVLVTATTRPVQHWDSTILETVTPTGSTKTWTLHIGDSFSDVANTSGFYRFIETIFHNQVTGGCGGTAYCPSNSATREQMAPFVLVSREGPGYNPPACAPPNLFSDVPETSPFCKFIEELATRGVVTGCGTNLYCPTDPVTREQMAVFVLRTLDPTLNPPACVAGSEAFGDVPASSGFCKWIEELARRGVVTGCGGGNYCPTNPVTREQMAVFLTATFGLQLYGL
jgi:subtilisin-like proprotein convertase family protein